MSVNAECVGLEDRPLGHVANQHGTAPSFRQTGAGLTWPAKIRYNGCEVAGPQDYFLPGSPSDNHAKAVYAYFHFRVKRALIGK